MSSKIKLYIGPGLSWDIFNDFNFSNYKIVYMADSIALVDKLLKNVLTLIFMIVFLDLLQIKKHKHKKTKTQEKEKKKIRLKFYC